MSCCEMKDLIIRVVPYPDMSNSETMTKVLEGYRLPKPKDCPEALYELMKTCWLEEPNDRPDFKGIQKKLRTAYDEYKTTLPLEDSPPSSKRISDPTEDKGLYATHFR